MEVVIGLILLIASVASMVLGTVAFFWSRKLSQTISSLQQDLAALQSGDGVTKSPLDPQVQDVDPETPFDSDEPISADAETKEEEFTPPEQDLPPIAAQVGSDDPSFTSEPETTTAVGPNFEQKLGGKWAVWVGGLALALGAVFLVKFSIEQGLLSPRVRIALGLGFSLALMALGEWTRRRGAFFSVPGYERANIPATLTAAGSIGVFASVFVAYALYDFIGPTLAFVILGAVALGTMTAALLHGPGLAALGLLGAYVAPFMVSTSDPKAWALALYVLFVSAAAFAVARWRLWRWLAISAAIGLIVYALILTAMTGSGDRLVLDLYWIISFAMAAYVFVVSIYPANPDHFDSTDQVATGLLSALILCALPMIVTEHANWLGFVELVLVITAGYGLAYFYSGVRYVVVASMVVGALRYLSVAVPQPNKEGLVTEIGNAMAGFGSDGPGTMASLIAVENVNSFLIMGGILSVAVIATGYKATSQRASRTQLSIGATILPIVLLIIAWLRVESFARSYVFFFFALVLMAVFAIIATRLLSSEAQPADAEESDVQSNELWPTSIFLVASFATLALAVSIVLEQGFLTITLAFIVPAIAYVYRWRPMPGLKPMALGIMAIWAIRVAIEPSIVEGEISTTPFFNGLLYGWGLSSAAFISACYFFTWDEDEHWMDMIEGVTIAAVTITIAILMIHAWDPSQVFTEIDTLAESGFAVMTGGGVALGLAHARRKWSRTMHWGINALGYGGMLAAALLLMVLYNPFISGEQIGTGLIFNGLLIGYLMPSIIYGVLSVSLKRFGQDRYSQAAAASSGLLAFTWVSLSIRNYFQQGNIGSSAMPDAELYTYSVVWLIIGIIVLAVGILRNNRMLRSIAAGLIVLVILKVFLVDMSSLTGIWRALSFIGLGGVLVAVGLVYQRFLSQIGDNNDQPTEQTIE